MQLNSSVSSGKKVRGWIFDVYPSALGKIAVWIIGEDGKRVRFVDSLQPKIYVYGKEYDLERLTDKFFLNQTILSWNFASKYAHPTDAQKAKVLEVTLADSRKTSALTQSILKEGNYLQYEVSNCDLHGDRAYLFSHDLFPL